MASIIAHRPRGQNPRRSFGTIDGRDYVFVGAERTNGIFQFDITNFGNVFINGYINLSGSASLNSVGSSPDYSSPESILFVAAADNATGQNILIVGYEGEGSQLGGSNAVIQAVPEPSVLVTLLGGFGLLALRRRRTA